MINRKINVKIVTLPMRLQLTRDRNKDHSLKLQNRQLDLDKQNKARVHCNRRSKDIQQHHRQGWD